MNKTLTVTLTKMNKKLLVNKILLSSSLQPYTRFILCACMCLLLHTASGAVEVETPDATDVTASAEMMVLREHEDFVHTFTVTNPYERAVRIDKTDTSCTCIEFELSDKFLLPDESCQLKVRVSNERYSGARKYKVWLYLTDPEYAPLLIRTDWIVKEDIAVDLILTDPSKRPDDNKYRDIYRYIAHVRPDEGKRLRKYIRISTPDKIEGGLQITPSYNGKIWGFSTKTLDEHSVLLIAKAKDPKVKLESGLFQEIVRIETNHDKKKSFELQFNSNIDPKAGTQEQAVGGFDAPQQ